MTMPTRPAAAALALGAALACSGVQPVPPSTPVSPESVREAAARLEAFDAARDDVALEEGGLRAAVRTWRWEEREAPLPSDLEIQLLRKGPVSLPAPVRERVLVGPFDRVIPWRRIEAVRVHRWAIGTSIELDVEGEPEPLLVGVEDAEAAPLAEAIDLLRRANAERPAEEGPVPVE